MPMAIRILLIMIKSKRQFCNYMVQDDYTIGNSHQNKTANQRFKILQAILQLIKDLEFYHQI